MKCKTKQDSRGVEFRINSLPSSPFLPPDSNFSRPPTSSSLIQNKVPLAPTLQDCAPFNTLLLKLEAPSKPPSNFSRGGRSGGGVRISSSPLRERGEAFEFPQASFEKRGGFRISSSPLREGGSSLANFLKPENCFSSSPSSTFEVP